jgi:hypothetical protein
LHQFLVQLHVHGFTGAVGEHVELIELQLRSLCCGHHVRGYDEQECGRKFQNVSEEVLHN